MPKLKTTQLNIDSCLNTLRACQEALAAVRSGIALGRMDAKRLQHAKPFTFEYMVRAALVTEMWAVSRNLGLIQTMRGAGVVSVAFDGSNAAKKQGNKLAQSYHVFPETIDWAQVMETVDHQYPKLESAVKKAIEELELKKGALA